jgi:hypothetical protein
VIESGLGTGGGDGSRGRLFLKTLQFPPSTHLISQNDMDFSQMNAAEQAQMSRILEKKQVEFSKTTTLRCVR